jgi:hypothetical protein
MITAPGGDKQHRGEEEAKLKLQERGTGFGANHDLRIPHQTVSYNGKGSFPEGLMSALLKRDVLSLFLLQPTCSCDSR